MNQNKLLLFCGSTLVIGVLFGFILARATAPSVSNPDPVAANTKATAATLSTTSPADYSTTSPSRNPTSISAAPPRDTHARTTSPRRSRS